MEKRFDLSMLVSNGKGCGYIDHKTFIGKKLEEVIEFIEKHANDNQGLEITYTVFEGWGFNQKQIRKMYSC
jgi:pyruvate-formate lyase-activating enzyme